MKRKEYQPAPKGQGATRSFPKDPMSTQPMGHSQAGSTRAQAAGVDTGNALPLPTDATDTRQSIRLPF
jgi:hypothetical protein